MSETVLRQNIIKILKHRHARSVENRCGSGTPDVNYADGWIELKMLKKWPAREHTPVKIRHFTPQQKIWISDRWEAGGAVYLLIQVNKTFLLYNGCDVQEIGSVTRERMIELAARQWEGLAALKEGLIQCLER